MECQSMKAFAYLVFPNSVISVIPEGLSHMEGERMEHGIITSVTHGVMSGSFHAPSLLYVSHVYIKHQTTFFLWYTYRSLIMTGVVTDMD